MAERAGFEYYPSMGRANLKIKTLPFRSAFSAERAGFEPANLCGLHAFQACALSQTTRPLHVQTRVLYHRDFLRLLSCLNMNRAITFGFFSLLIFANLREFFLGNPRNTCTARTSSRCSFGSAVQVFAARVLSSRQLLRQKRESQNFLSDCPAV